MACRRFRRRPWIFIRHDREWEHAINSPLSDTPFRLSSFGLCTSSRVSAFACQRRRRSSALTNLRWENLHMIMLVWSQNSSPLPTDTRQAMTNEILPSRSDTVTMFNNQVMLNIPYLLPVLRCTHLTYFCYRVRLCYQSCVDYHPTHYDGLNVLSIFYYFSLISS